jgi:hypothetical protein
MVSNINFLTENAQYGFWRCFKSSLIVLMTLFSVSACATQTDADKEEAECRSNKKYISHMDSGKDFCVFSKKPELKDWITKSSVIFTGTVKSVSACDKNKNYLSNSCNIDFTDVNHIKGMKFSNYVVNNIIHDGNRIGYASKCGFNVGEKYLIYGFSYGERKNGTPSIDIVEKCNPSKKLSEAREDLELINKLEKGK